MFNLIFIGLVMDRRDFLDFGYLGDYKGVVLILFVLFIRFVLMLVLYLLRFFMRDIRGRREYFFG